MFNREFSRKSELLQAFLGAEADEEAKAAGFVERDSKMSGKDFARTVMLGWMDNPEGSLNDLVQCSAELGVTISESGLHQRINESGVAFLKRLLVRGMQTLREDTRLPNGVFRNFSSVNLLDSSQIVLPDVLQTRFAGKGGRGGAVAAVKLQLSFEYLSGSLNTVQLEAGREPDQNCRLHLAYAEPNSLHLFDLGYFKQEVFEQLADAQAYFVSRLQLQTGLYMARSDEQPLDLLAFLNTQSGELSETQVYLGNKTRLSVRLVFQKLPAAVVEERRRKAKLAAHKRGKTCSQRHLALIEWMLFITNAPSAWLTAEQALVVYRLRWQVELIFKLWKSQAKIEHVGAYRPERMLCQLYARLIALVVFHWAVAPYRVQHNFELSLTKSFRIMQRYAFRLVEVISAGWHTLTHLLRKMADDFLRFASKNARTKSPSTYDLLLLSGA